MSTTEKGREFEKKVGALFSLLGYSVEHDLLIAGRQFDLFLEDRSGPLTRKYLVECKDEAKPTSTSHYDQFHSKIKAAKNQQDPKLRGIMVSSVGFVKNVKEQSAYDDIELLTVSELEQQLIDFRPYVANLISQLDSDRDLEHFVEVKSRRENLTRPEPFARLLEHWLRDPVLNHMTLLGDYGTGKTTLLKHLALDMAKAYQRTTIERGGRERVPIYINLSEHTHAISLKQIVLDYLDSHGVRTASYAAFDHVLKEGQVILLLDGFDEMASRGNYKVTLRNFRELNRNAQGRAKIILSCRTHYFSTEREVHRFLGEPGDRLLLPQSHTDLYRDVAARPNFLIVHLLEFGPDQIRSYLQSRMGDAWGEVQSFIESTYNLKDLSKRPVLLEMIVTSQRSLESVERVTPGILYREYTSYWLTKNDWSTILDVRGKTSILERAAISLATGNQEGIHYEDIPDLIRQWDPRADKIETAEIDRELRTATFLTRDGDGNYKFSHKSFLEFFCAQHLVSEASRDSKTYWSSELFNTEIYRFIRDLLYEAPKATTTLVSWLADLTTDGSLRANAAKCLGAIRERAVQRALVKTVAKDPAAEARRAAAASLGSFPDDGVEKQLIESAKSDEDRWVRSNCLKSLLHMGKERGKKLLKEVVGRTTTEVAVDTGIMWPIYRALHEHPDSELIEICIANAPSDLGPAKRRHLALACLDLCELSSSPAAARYREIVLSATTRPKLVSKAFSQMPLPTRKKFTATVLPIIRQQSDEGNGTRVSVRDFLVVLISSLAGTRQAAVRDGLVELLDNTREAEIATTAFTVLVADHPETAAEAFPGWMKKGQGRPGTLRIGLARIAAKSSLPSALEEVVALLNKREAVATRIGAIKVLFRHFKSRYCEIIEPYWPTEDVTIVKRTAIEYMYSLDEEQAGKLLISGLTSSRNGTRAMACAMLSAESSPDVDRALLQTLREDDLKWVRLEALRSLCVPGRSVDRETIRQACREEKDVHVLRLLEELIG